MHLRNKVFTALGFFSYDQIADALSHSVLKYEFVARLLSRLQDDKNKQVERSDLVH